MNINSTNVVNTLKRLWDQGALYIIGGSFLSKIAAFLGSIVVVRILSKSDYGILASLENIYTYAYVLAGYGLNNALLRYMVLEGSDRKREGIFLYVIKSGTAFNIALILVAWLVGHCVLPQGTDSFSGLLSVMLLALPLQFVYDSSLNALRSLFKNRLYAAFAFAGVLLIWLLKVIGAQSFGLDGAVFSWLITYFVLGLCSLIVVKKVSFKQRNYERVGSGLAKEMRTYSVQYMITNGLWALFFQNDLLMIGSLTGDPSAVANYKVAYSIPAAMSIFSSSIGVFVAPYFVRHEKEPSWVRDKYWKILSCSVILIGSASLALYLFSEPLISFMYGTKYADAAGLLRLLLISGFANNAVRFTTANLMAAMGQIKANLIISAAGMSLQLLLNSILIPVYHSYGAAYSSITVYSLMAAAIMICFVRKYHYA